MLELFVTYIFMLPTYISPIVEYKIITREKLKTNYFNILALFVITAICLYLKYFKAITVSLILNIIAIEILLFLFFRIDKWKSIYYTIILSIISLSVDSIIAIMILNPYIKNFENLMNNYILRGLLNIPVNLIVITICMIPILQIAINNLYNKWLLNIKMTKPKFFLLIDILAMLIILFTLNGYSSMHRFGHIIIILGISSFTLLFSIALFLLYKEDQIRNQNKNIVEENKYIKSIIKMEEDFKHNLINNLLSIKTKSDKKTATLIDALIDEYQIGYENVSNINELPEGIQSVIYKKTFERKIEDLNIIVDNEIKNDLYDILSPKRYNDFCTSIGIVFDNALDAVLNVKEKVIEMTFYEDNNNIYIVLKNSFSNIVDLDEIGTRSYTTKEQGHGIGLAFINKLKKIELKNEIINNMFISKMTVKK